MCQRLCKEVLFPGFSLLGGVTSDFRVQLRPLLSLFLRSQHPNRETASLPSICLASVLNDLDFVLIAGGKERLMVFVYLSKEERGVTFSPKSSMLSI